MKKTLLITLIIFLITKLYCQPSGNIKYGLKLGLNAKNKYFNGGGISSTFLINQTNYTLKTFDTGINFLTGFNFLICFAINAAYTYGILKYKILQNF